MSDWENKKPQVSFTFDGDWEENREALQAAFSVDGKPMSNLHFFMLCVGIAVLKNEINPDSVKGKKDPKKKGRVTGDVGRTAEIAEGNNYHLMRAAAIKFIGEDGLNRAAVYNCVERLASAGLKILSLKQKQQNVRSWYQGEIYSSLD
jgi:hypothetical protein